MNPYYEQDVITSKSLESVTATVDEERRLILVCLCDCATVTHLTLELPPDLKDHELAFTCDGCLTSHWFKIGTPPALYFRQLPQDHPE